MFPSLQNKQINTNSKIALIYPLQCMNNTYKDCCKVSKAYERSCGDAAGGIFKLDCLISIYQPLYFLFLDLIYNRSRKFLFFKLSFIINLDITKFLIPNYKNLIDIIKESKQMTEKDKQIRQKLKKQDIDLSNELQEEMRKEEDLLKNYFKEYKKPQKDDPTVVKKQRKAEVEDRAAMYKSALSSVNLFRSFYEDFWNMKLSTPEEQTALTLAKQNIMFNVLKCSLGCLLVTSFTSYKQRMYLRWPGHLFGAITGLGTGIILGIAISTEDTFHQFEKLGENYDFSRKVIYDLEKNRMDKK